MVYDGVKPGHKLSFVFRCPVCEKPTIHYETKCEQGKAEEALSKRVRLRCPVCGHDDLFYCNMAEETRMVKV